MMKRSRLIWILAAVSLMWGVVNPAFGQDTKQLTINEVFYPDTGFAIETDDAFAMSRWGMIETLVRVDFDGQLVPGLATAWEQRDDNTWAFTLREGVTFQNGEAFDADAVVTALSHLLETETPPRGLDTENITAIEAEDATTVIVTTAAADPIFPNRLIRPSTGILAPSAYESTPPEVMGTGTGPFILTDFELGQSANLVKNENYWGGEVALDEVLVLATPEGEMRATMLRTGEIDIASQVPIPQLPILENDSEISIVRLPQPRTVTLYLNNESGPMANVLLRRAVLHAVNKPLLVEAVLEGVGQPAAGPFAPNEAWVNPDFSADTFDPELARELLAEAGIAEGELTVRLWTYPSRPAQPPLAVAIQQMLGDVGITADVRISPYNTLEPSVLEGDFDIFIVSRGHLIDSYDPESFLRADFGCGGGYNLNLYCNPDVDALLDEALETADTEARYEIYRDVQAIIDEEVVSVFLNYTEQLYGFRSNVVNFRPHPLEYYVLTSELDVAE